MGMWVSRLSCSAGGRLPDRAMRESRPLPRPLLGLDMGGIPKWGWLAWIRNLVFRLAIIGNDVRQPENDVFALW